MYSILQPEINMKFFQIPVIFYTPKPFLQIQAKQLSYYARAWPFFTTLKSKHTPTHINMIHLINEHFFRFRFRSAIIQYTPLNDW